MWIWFLEGRLEVGKSLELPACCAGMCGMKKEPYLASRKYQLLRGQTGKMKTRNKLRRGQTQEKPKESKHSKTKVGGNLEKVGIADHERKNTGLKCAPGFLRWGNPLCPWGLGVTLGSGGVWFKSRIS